jgi:translation initiation factor IF-1
VSKSENIEAEGTVTACHKGGKFTVLLDDNGHEALGHLAGRMRRNRIRILPGDRVAVELSPAGFDLCRIVYRYL